MWHNIEAKNTYAYAYFHIFFVEGTWQNWAYAFGYDKAWGRAMPCSFTNLLMKSLIIDAFFS